MCNFVPGQVVAIGPTSLLSELGPGLPGKLGRITPILEEDLPESPKHGLAGLASVSLKTEPGNEILGVSLLSSRLARAIEKKTAAVDLNHYLPLSNAVQNTGGSERLGPHARREAAALRQLLRQALRPNARPLRVAVLDSGLRPDFLGHRDIRYLDYSDSGRLRRDGNQIDPLGHGTRVTSILDSILPAGVAISVGRLPATNSQLTALAVSHALGDIVVREAPDVVNLSVAIRNDWFVCPHCRQRVPAPTFLSALIPLVIRLAGAGNDGSITVMAAGNAGQLPNSRWLTDDVQTLVFAIAENRRNERTRYSNEPVGPAADLFTVGAFGGDDPEEAGAEGVFEDGLHGTSFAAPFVSAAVLLAKQTSGPRTRTRTPPFGVIAQDIIDSARSGRYPGGRPRWPR